MTVPSAFRDTANVCTTITVDGETAGLGCGAHTDVADQPHTSYVPVRAGSVAVAVFPVGITSGELEIRGGSRTPLRIEDGVAIVKLDGEPTTLTWTGERGRGTRNVE